MTIKWTAQDSNQTMDVGPFVVSVNVGDGIRWNVSIYEAVYGGGATHEEAQEAANKAVRGIVEKAAQAVGGKVTWKEER